MTASEQQAFAQVRARIERNVGEIASLAQDASLSSGEFFQKFLVLTLEAVDAMGGAVWLVSGPTQANRVAEVSFASCGFEQDKQREWIGRALECAVSTGKPCIVAVQEQVPETPEPVGNAVPHPFFYIPVVLGTETPMVLQIWLKQAGDPRHYAEITAFLSGLAQQASLHLRGAERAVLLKDQARYRQMLGLQETMLGELDPKAVAAGVANYLVDLLPCALSAVAEKKGKRWRLWAASNQETVDPSADQSQALAELIAVLPLSQKARFFPDEKECFPESLSAALAKIGYQTIAWCHLPPSKKAPLSTLLLACWHEPLKDRAAPGQSLDWAAAQFARALDAATHFHHLPMRKATAAAGRVIRAWNEDRRRRVLTWVGAPLFLLLLALLFPAPYKIKSDCAVVPARTTAVVAETEGKILEVLVAEGTEVRAGQLLARLEDTDYAAQLAISKQQLSRHRVEAARAQALGNEAERKMGELAVRREEENIKRLEYLRARTELRAPLDGLVLTRGVQHRAGEALERGKVFCEIGSLGAYELELDLRQQDLGLLLRALGSGRPLPVDFILHAHARSALKGEISGVMQVSQLPLAKTNEMVFVARLPFPEASLEGGIKAGYTGRASIRLGWRPWGWLLLQPALQYWRMNWSL